MGKIQAGLPLDQIQNQEPSVYPHWKWEDRSSGDEYLTASEVTSEKEHLDDSGDTCQCRDAETGFLLGKHPEIIQKLL